MMKQKKTIRYLKPKKRPKYPRNFERDYYRVLRAVVRRLKSATNNNMPMLSYSLRSDDENTITDDVIQAILDELLQTMTLEEALQELEMILAGVSSVVDANIISAFAETVSVDVFLQEPALMRSVKAEWLAQQKRYTKGLVNDYLEKLQNVLSRAVQRGTPMAEVEDEIQHLFGVTDNAAKFIARNGVSDLNGILTKRRQMDCGISVYQWSSSHDNRVRKSHAEMDGKYFYWNSDKVGEINGVKVYPSPKYHPGMDVNCRCVAIPIIDLAAWNMTEAIPNGQIKPNKNKELS